MQIVPDSEIFRRKKMISPNMVCTVFNRTPPSLVPEELHSRGRLNMSSGRSSSRKRRKSPEEVEEEELNACVWTRSTKLMNWQSLRHILIFVLHFLEKVNSGLVLIYFPTKL